MRVTFKIILTVVLFMIGGIIVESIKEAMGTRHSTGGIGPIIIFPALLAGISAIWKWNPDKKKDNSADNEILKKD